MAPRPLTPLLLLAFGASCSGGDGYELVTKDPALIPVPSEARLAALDGELVDAIRAARGRIEQDPADHQAWLELGMTYEAHSMLEEAWPCYREAARLADTEPRAWLRLGLAQAKAGELAAAVDSFERLLELDASYEPARLRLGYLHLDAGDPVSARSVFELVLRKTPSEPAALQGLAQCDLDEGEPQSALERLAPASLREGAQRPLTQRLRGLALARLGRNAEAEIALAEGLAAKPVIQDPWSREVNRFKVGLSALIMRAQKLVDRGKVPAALELIEVHRDAGDTRVLRLLGKAYARQGRFADAAGALADAFVLEPDAPELALALAAAYSQDLRTGEASSVLIGFLERSPQHIGPWRGYQELAFKTAAVELVLEIRDKAFRAGHRDVELETVAGHAAMALERFDVAEERYSAALDAGPATAEIHLGRARARIELEDFRGAGDDLVVAAGMGHPDVEEVRMLYDKRRQGRRD